MFEVFLDGPVFAAWVPPAHLPVSQTLSQPARTILRPPNLQSTTTNPRLQLECVPLTGGPLWPPIHVQVAVVVDDENNNPPAAKE